MFSKIRKAWWAVMLAPLALVVGFAAPASASPTPTAQAFTDAKDGIVGIITNNGIPLIIAVLLVGIGVTLLVKYVRKGVRSA